MRRGFEDGRDLLIAGVNKHYTAETRSNIPAQWTSFAPQIGKIPGQVGKVSYGVCWNYKPPCTFDYLSGVEVKEGKDCLLISNSCNFPPSAMPCSPTAITFRIFPKRSTRFGPNGCPNRDSKRPANPVLNGTPKTSIRKREWAGRRFGFRLNRRCCTFLRVLRASVVHSSTFTRTYRS